MADTAKSTGTMEIPVKGTDASAENANLAAAIGIMVFKIVSVARTSTAAAEKWVIEFEYAPKK